MKPITKNSSFILILFLLMLTCAKETEETNTNINEKIFKNEKVDAKTAMADWLKFNSTADNLLAITTTNLKSLQAKSEKALDKMEKEALTDSYKQTKNQFIELKNRLEKENIVFKKDLTTYNKQTEIKYHTFKNLFLHDILELNNNLEDILDEINSN
ncbi:hypothetical protein QWY90_10905 [Flavobacterium paronense]|uniref:Uncharacterized protein n=1 Tax=Flavobacterium paronense TaxID=1392775 RepID=A0ABV5GC51_9FLAO|nr:hypothetical protein [Flavobacterium paronense]MDN3677818.1 hypothetical protein [Flavobacterium paronense]